MIDLNNIGVTLLFIAAICTIIIMIILLIGDLLNK